MERANPDLRRWLNGIAHRLFLLHFLQDLRRRGNLFRDFLLHGIEFHILLLLLLPVETLVRGHGNQP